MTEKTLTTEKIKPALDALRGELAPWPVVAMKQDRLNDTQKSAVNSGITSSLVAQIIANTAAIRALESAITGTGLRALVVASLPAIGTQGILYIVPVTTYDPATDADVVNYSNEYLWIVAPDAPVTEGYYEQVGQTGIVINNGQLTITVNGTSVGTFTANQSGDTTAAITVPTNADYVDRTADQTVAGDKTWTGEQSFTLPIVGSITGTASKAIADEDGTSIKTGYVNVAGNQTVSGQKTWTGENSFSSNANFGSNVMITGDRLRLYDKNDQVNVTPSSSITKHIYFTDKNGTAISYFAFQHRNVSSEPFRTCWRQQKLDGTNNYYSIDFNNLGEFYPETLNVSLGTSTNQWSSVYAQTYYYNGVAWGLDKDNVWSGYNTYTNVLLTLKHTALEVGVLPASNQTRRYRFTDKNNTDLGWLQHRVNTSGDSYLECLVVNKFSNGQLSTQGNDIINSLILGLSSDGSRWLKVLGDVYPDSPTRVCNLGTSTNKWKTINGINPGALSLPKTDAMITISVSEFLFNGSDEFMPDVSGLFSSGIAQVNGWLVVRLKEGTGHYIFLNSNISASAPGVIQSCFSPGVVTTLQFGLSCSVPVCTGHKPSVRWAKPDGGNAYIYFIPCLGNV